MQIKLVKNNHKTDSIIDLLAIDLTFYFFIVIALIDMIYQTQESVHNDIISKHLEVHEK